MKLFTGLVALAALASTAVPALAQDVVAVPRHHAYRTVTVRPAVADATVDPSVAAQSRAYDPYSGPGVIVSGPVALGSGIAALPFRALGQVFPAHGDTPLFLVGAPLALAGELVQLPFRIVEAPFRSADGYSAF